VSSCSKPTLFDHLVGAREQRRRNFDAQRLRRLQVDDQFEFGRLLNRQISRLGTFENAVDVIRRTAE
jgi:hypothetical protein